MALRVIHLLKISTITYCFYTFLQWDDFVITGHDDHCPELQTFCQVHCANRYVSALRIHMLIQHLEWQASFCHGLRCPIHLGCRTNEHPELMGHKPNLSPFSYPTGNALDLVAYRFQHMNGWLRAIENRNRVTPVFGDSVRIGHRRPKQPIGL
ncbi:hypothetical protein D3C78_1446560 [compost metagenome]